MKPQKVIAQLRTKEFRAVLEEISMSCTDVKSEDTDAVSNTPETPSSRTLTEFKETRICSL